MPVSAVKASRVGGETVALGDGVGVGSGGVTLIDPSEMADSNAAELEPGAPIRITNMRLHALTSGARYDLDFRRAID